MRQDQYERLQALSERIADVVLNDADPDHWSGNGKKPNELTQQERGDAYWCRKMAAASIMLFGRVEAMIGQQQGPGTTPLLPPTGADDEEADRASQLDAEITRAEKEAMRLLDDMQRSSKKAAFDARTHGKP